MKRLNQYVLPWKMILVYCFFVWMLGSAETISNPVARTIDEFSETTKSEVAHCFVDGECRGSLSVGINHPGSTNACHDYCKADPDCQYFTYYTEEDACIIFKDCITLSSLGCDTCVTAEVRRPEEQQSDSLGKNLYSSHNYFSGILSGSGL